MTQPDLRLKSALTLALTAVLAIGSTGCVVVPGRHGPRAVVVAPPPVYMAPAPVVVAPAPFYLAPTYASPGPGWVWEHHGHHGWGWRHHHHRGWHRGWR